MLQNDEQFHRVYFLVLRGTLVRLPQDSLYRFCHRFRLFESPIFRILEKLNREILAFFATVILLAFIQVEWCTRLLIRFQLRFWFDWRLIRIVALDLIFCRDRSEMLNLYIDQISTSFHVHLAHYPRIEVFCLRRLLQNTRVKSNLSLLLTERGCVLLRDAQYFYNEFVQRLVLVSVARKAF